MVLLVGGIGNMSKYIYVDLEFNNTSEKHPELVCCSWMSSEDSEIHNISLLNRYVELRYRGLYSPPVRIVQG